MITHHHQKLAGNADSKLHIRETLLVTDAARLSLSKLAQFTLLWSNATSAVFIVFKSAWIKSSHAPWSNSSSWNKSSGLLAFTMECRNIAWIHNLPFIHRMQTQFISWHGPYKRTKHAMMAGLVCYLWWTEHLPWSDRDTRQHSRRCRGGDPSAWSSSWTRSTPSHSVGQFKA
jgi:hypothetical protein